MTTPELQPFYSNKLRFEHGVIGLIDHGMTLQHVEARNEKLLHESGQDTLDVYRNTPFKMELEGFYLMSIHV